MANSLIASLARYPLAQKITFLILFVTLLVQFGAMLYLRFSMPLTTPNAKSVLEKGIGEVTDVPATYYSPEVVEGIPPSARIPHSTPNYYQMERGTCWAFALIGFLEDNYRQNGIQKGFLKESEYLRLSEQVLGIRMVEHCEQHPDVCNTPGDDLLRNSTSGGEINWFWSFPGLYNEMLPYSVCPYSPGDDNEFVCDGLDEATQSNPIRFNVTKMNVAMTVNDAKKLFIEKGKRALAWTSLIHDSFEYFPCSSYSDLCNSEKYPIISCPASYDETDCVRITIPMHTPDGEFDRMNEMMMAGGHGMVVVGYNDEFVTKAGFKGGFILKNSWEDTIYGTYPGETSRNARGSHSIEYYMGEVSSEDEKYICPNPQDPLSWTTCGIGCYDHPQIQQELLNVTRTPNEFQCVDEMICSKDEVYRYFLSDFGPAARQPDGRYFDFCMTRVNTLDDSTVELCYNALPLQVIALYFTPIDSQLKVLIKNEDYCGHYFFPYELLEQQISYFGGFNCIYYDIDWEDSSYEKKANDKYDYTFVHKSTGEQIFSEIEFMASCPYINKRYY
ncbi:Papain family cysteine protease domain containing protein [Entamoeba marina]